MKKRSFPNHDYARYTSTALQMAVVIFLGVYGGLRLDRWIGIRFPVFTIVLSLVSVALAIYLIIREFLKRK